MQIEKDVAHGLTREQIADNLGIGVSTLYRKTIELRELGEAIKRGKRKDASSLGGKLTQIAMDDNPKFRSQQLTALIFSLKTKHGWRERIEHTGASGAPISITPIEWVNPPKRNG